MSADSALPLDLVSAHASSLRALVRSLALDEHATDDVVQETWVRALTAGPPDRERIGGWLRRVAEGFAHQRRRSEARRADREKRYAREKPESVSDTTARAETLRAVVDAVLALDEPYRETILMRWFEGLPPRDIAVRQTTSVATVNSRLQRAHSILRQRLSRQLGLDERELRGALLALCGTKTAHAIAPVAASFSFVGIAMTTTKLISTVGLAIVALCALLYFGRGDAEPLAPLLAAPSAGRSALETASIAAVQPDGSKRVEAVASNDVQASEPGAATAPAPYVFDVTIVPIDEFGRPRPRTVVWIGLDLERTALLGETGWNGELHSVWRGSEPVLDLVLELRARGIVEGVLHRVRLGASAPERIVVAVDSDGAAPILGNVLSFASAPAADRPEHVRNFGFELTTGSPVFGLDSAGNGVITDPWLLNRIRTEGPQPYFFSAASAGSISLGGVVRMRPMLSGAQSETDESAYAHLRGLVQDENAQPLADVLVTVFAESGPWSAETRTDANGTFDVQRIPPGKALILAGGGAHVLRRESFEKLEGGEARTLRIVCPTAVRTAVRLVLEDGSPLAQWRVEARRRDRNETTIDRAEADANGRANLALPLSESVRLYARPAGRPGAPQILLDPDFLAGSNANDVVVHGDPALAGYQIESHSKAENDCGYVVMRLWRVDSNAGIPAALVDVQALDGGATNRSLFRGSGLLPGEYMLEYGSRGMAWKRIGPFFFAPGATFEAGPLAIDDPAFVTVTAPDGPSKANFQASTIQQGLRVQSPLITSEVPSTLLLAAGEYRLDVGRAAQSAAPASNGLSQNSPVALRPLATTELTLQCAEHRSIEIELPR